MNLNQCFSWKNPFHVPSFSLALSAVVQHNKEVCLKELSAHRGSSQGEGCHGSSTGMNSELLSIRAPHEWVATSYKESLYKAIQVILGSYKLDG